MLSESGIPGGAAEGGSEIDRTILKEVREMGGGGEVQNVHEITLIRNHDTRAHIVII